MSRRRQPTFVTWTADDPRGREISRALGGTPVRIHPDFGERRAGKLARYALSVPLTFIRLARERPSAVIATNPPAFAMVCGYLYARLAGRPFVADTHPGAYGRQGDRLSSRLTWLTRWVVRRADATLVTDALLSAQVRAWGGRPLVVHEAPHEWEIDTPPAPGDVPAVLLINVFLRDEPVEVATQAADGLPARLRITGHRHRAPAGLVASAPANVEFTGYLTGEDYVRAIADADVVVVLTTEPTSVPRAAYEAVRGLRPLVISASDATRENFPGATHVANEPAALRAGIAAALAAPRAEVALRADRDALDARWAAQLAELQAVIG